MRNIKIKKTLIPILVVTLAAGIATVGATRASAQTSGNHMTGLVEMLAQKFGLDKNQVQSAVDDYRTQQQANWANTANQRQQNRLDKLVTDGKITAAQKQAILDELTKLRSEYTPADWKNLTPQQRLDKFNALQAEVKAWSESTGINQIYLMPGLGMGRLHRGGFWRFGL